MTQPVAKVKPPFQQEDTNVFNLAPNVLQSLQLMFFDSDTTREMSPLPLEKTPEPTTVTPRETTPDLTIAKDKDYYKSDLHRFNLKRAQRHLPPVTEDEFNQLAQELIEVESDSDDSGFEDSDDERERRVPLDTIFERSMQRLEALKLEESTGVVSHLANRTPFVLFKSDLLPEDKCFGVYKSIFDIKGIETPLETITNWKNSKTPKKSAIFMLAGGYFSGAIVSHTPKSTKGNTPKAGESLIEMSVDFIEKKNFRRYTTRKKQGGSQSANDNAKGKAKSVGANMRRQNEMALEQDVRALIQSWKSHLDQCELIFIRASKHEYKTIVGYENSVIKSNDQRIRSFPFTTKKPITRELRRAWINLTYLTITDKPSVDERKFKQKQIQEQLKQSKIQKEKEVKEEAPEIEHTRQIVEYLKKAKFPLLLAYVKKNKLGPQFELQPSSEYHNTPTLLHFASANGSKNLIGPMIKTLKCDPTVQNSKGKTPCDVGPNKSIKQAFQIVRHELGESVFDWDAAHVGEPISREEVEKAEQEANELEERWKRELLEEELKKSTPAPATSKQRLGGVSITEVNVSSLSDAQRMRLDRERRARAAEERFKKMQSGN